jgi:tetratricopeptide (TPR) repeat protein
MTGFLMSAWMLTAAIAPGALGPAAAQGDRPLAALFFAVPAEPSPQRDEALFTLWQALTRAKLPVAAMTYESELLREGPSHPHYQAALEALVAAQERLGDEYLIPSLLEAQETKAWADLPMETRARVDFLIAVVKQRKGLLDAAKERLLAVPWQSAVYAKAQYLLGIVLADPRMTGGANNAAALEAFGRVRALRDGHEEALANTKLLAQLGEARTLYGMGRFLEATAAYDAVPRFSTYWDQALFENGYARFRAGDLGGALGSLQALHAPQFEGAFLPESWILKGTIYYFSCLYGESKSALNAFDRVYAPMLDQLRPLAKDSSLSVTDYYRLLGAEDARGLPRPVRVWVLSNERLSGLIRMLSETQREEQTLSREPELSASTAGAALIGTLEATRATLGEVAGQLVKNRVEEAYRNLKAFSDQAEIIKFETTKAEKELVEAGIDQGALLASQRIHRPRAPGRNWDYWKFEGEFWIDEIGYYQYTLKRGCPSKAR